MSVPLRPSRRKLLAGGLGLAAGAVGLSACGAIPTSVGGSVNPSKAPSGGTSVGNTPSSNTASSRRPSGNPDASVTISFLEAMSSGAAKAALAKITEDFMAANTDISVELQEQPDDDTLQTELKARNAAGKPPTIAQVSESWVAEYAKDQAIVPLDAYIAKAQQYEDFYDGIKADLQLPDGKAWMWPFTTSVAVLYYNTDLVPKPPKTWDEFARVAGAVSKGKVVALSIDPGSSAEPAGGTTMLEILAQAFGDPVFGTDGTPQFTKPSVIKALQYLVDLKRAGALTLGKNDPGRVALANQTGAFDIAGVASYPDNVKAVGSKFRLGVAQLPTGPGGRVANQLAGTNLALFATADKAQKNAAWKFLQFLTEPVRQAYWSAQTGYLPVCQQATQQQDFKDYAARKPFVADATAQLNMATPLPAVTWTKASGGCLAAAIVAAVDHGKDPAAALQTAQAAAEKAKKRG